MASLEHTLQAIGLSEKEARVYLAGLALGPSTAQLIAAKATVNRPTTYIMIESLMKRGLISAFEKGKKRHFTAAPPEQLLAVLAHEREDISKKESAVKAALGEIREASRTAKAAVRVYEGVDPATILGQDMDGEGAMVAANGRERKAAADIAVRGSRVALWAAGNSPIAVVIDDARIADLARALIAGRSS